MRLPALLTAVAAALVAACNDPFAVLPASISNTVDTVEIYAVNGTGIDKPSGYVIAERRPLKLGLETSSYNFDFLYRIDASAGPQLVPFTVVAPRVDTTVTASGRAGFIPTTTAFESITIAEQVGYVVDKPQNVALGSTFYLRSGLPNGCYLGIPYYAKLQVISINPETRSIKVQILTDINCGYRGLEPGIPKK